MVKGSLRLHNQIGRNLSSCSNDVKVKCYKKKSLVRPQLEYAATIWDPYTYANSTEVGAVQWRAARFCFNNYRPGRVAQSVTCLATDACLTVIPGVASSIPARSHTFVEIDHEIISTDILLPSADSFKKGCCQLQAKVCARITG